MGVWGATPDPKQYFLALCSSNTPILGIQKHLPTAMSLSVANDGEKADALRV